MSHYQKQRDDSLMTGATHVIKSQYSYTMLYRCLNIKDGKKRALIGLGWLPASICDSVIDKYYDEVRPKKDNLQIGDLMVGERFYVCRTKEKGVVTGASVGGRVPVDMFHSLRDFTPGCGHTLNIQTRVKYLAVA